MLGAGPVKKVRERTKDMERRTEMSRFLALIVAAAMSALGGFIAGPAMAVSPRVDKSYTYSNDSTVDKSTEVTVTKEVDILVEGELEATGGIEVQGDVVFKEMDVQVQDEEVVNKFFELDDSATSTWFVEGVGVMSVAEQLQNGDDNVANITQDDRFDLAQGKGMHVALQYQVGNLNTATVDQAVCSHAMNNFAKQIQIGTGNEAIGSQQ